MQAGDGIVGEERVGPADESQMVAEILDGFAEVHGGELVAHGDPLIECGEDAQAELAIQGWLANQEQGQGALRVHLGIGQEAKLFELFRSEQVGFVHDEDHPAAAFLLLSSKEALGLSHQLGPEATRNRAEGADDADVEPAGAESRVGHVVQRHRNRRMCDASSSAPKRLGPSIG